MATLSMSNGRHRIQLFDTDGKRRSVSLGKMPKKSAEYIRVRIDDLESSAISGRSPSKETSSWLAELGQTMKEKLAKVGLIEPADASTFSGYLFSYVDSRTDIKAVTRGHIKRAGESFSDNIGEKKLREVTKGDAKRWYRSLLDSGLSENTARRMCGRVKQVFIAAMEDCLVEKNPLNGLKTTVNANEDRFEFITTEAIETVIDAAPCAEWRLLIALARYGGLRTPSEPLRLKWTDIDWQRQRITVTSPKTAHHEGKGSRVIPIFPELKSHLNDVWELSEKSQNEFVINRYRDSSANLRTHFQRIIEKAGVKPWGKPWQNLRASRETELTKEFPLHVVTAWMGNSQPVALKHYLHVLDSDYEKAVSKSCADSVQRPSAKWWYRPEIRESAATVRKPLELQEVCDGHDDDTLLLSGDYPTRIRTLTDRIRICSATVTPWGSESC